MDPYSGEQKKTSIHILCSHNENNRIPDLDVLKKSLVYIETNGDVGNQEASYMSVKHKNPKTGKSEIIWKYPL